MKVTEPRIFATAAPSLTRHDGQRVCADFVNAEARPAGGGRPRRKT
jgi:hypothetical protein